MNVLNYSLFKNSYFYVPALRSRELKPNNLEPLSIFLMVPLSCANTNPVLHTT